MLVKEQRETLFSPERPLPSLPAWMIPKVWGVPQQLLSHYVKLEADGRCLIGGYKYLQVGSAV